MYYSRPLYYYVLNDPTLTCYILYSCITVLLLTIYYGPLLNDNDNTMGQLCNKLCTVRILHLHYFLQYNYVKMAGSRGAALARYFSIFIIFDGIFFNRIGF